jgi:hypothetical protein
VLGSWSAAGAFTPLQWDPIPNPPGAAAPYQLSGVLTASFALQYAAPLYPAGTTPTTPNPQGLLWLATPAGGARDEAYVPLGIYVYGLAEQW